MQDAHCCTHLKLDCSTMTSSSRRSTLFPYTTLFRSLKAIQFERENLLRILAKNQQADGSFRDLGTVLEGDVLETTLKSLLAFTADRKSTRLNSSHVKISYAAFAL